MDSMIEINKCPFCGCTNFQHHSKARYWQQIKLNFVECTECGLIFTNPMPDMDIVSRGNKALNILHKSRGTISQYRGGKEYAFSLKKIKQNGIFLDVGCAEGIFLKGIEDNCEWIAEGVEIIKSAVDFANEILKVKVHYGTLDSIQIEDDRYDYIRMNNVIEHIQDPVVFLTKAHKIIKKGGIVYCSTPNGVQDGQVLKIANKNGFEVNLLENHFYYYPPKTLRKIFMKCGFKINHAYTEDISHTLQDFGIISGFKEPVNLPEHKLDYYDDKSNTEFNLTEDEINSYKFHQSAKNWKILFNKYNKAIFRLRLPYFFPIGHQQHIYARKL
jgi:2-polyprenyl-3-methyl-5-hydroxy-6-metoxy-1,4-benzoquinol methylase